MKTNFSISVVLITLAAFVLACSNDPAKTRQQAANATEQLKQGTREAAGNIKKGAQVAKTDITAAAEGVKEGLNDRGSSQVNVNTASKAELMGLPGINEAQANAIIVDRPYRTPHQIVSRGAVSEDEYQKIASHLTASSASQH